MTNETEAALREALKRAGYASMGGQADRFLQEARALLATPQPTQGDQERAADLFERMACIADDEACVALIVAEFAAVRAEGMEWRPIESAPKDGHRVLLAGVNRDCTWIDIGHYAPYDGSRWNTDDRKQLQNPTHWLSLPRSPEHTTP